MSEGFPGGSGYEHRVTSSESPIDNPAWRDEDLAEPAPEGALPFFPPSSEDVQNSQVVETLDTTTMTHRIEEV